MTRLSVIEQDPINQDDDEQPVRSARRGDVPAKIYHKPADRRRAKAERHRNNRRKRWE